MAIEYFNNAKNFRTMIDGTEVLRTGYGTVLSDGEKVYFVNKNASAFLHDEDLHYGETYLVTDEALKQLAEVRGYANEAMDGIIGNNGDINMLVKILEESGKKLSEEERASLFDRLGLELIVTKRGFTIREKADDSIKEIAEWLEQTTNEFNQQQDNFKKEVKNKLINLH